MAPKTLPFWKARLSMYRDLSALTFEDREYLKRFVGLLWRDGPLYGMPRTFASGYTMIVPAEAVEYLRKRVGRKGIRFTESKVVSANELAPERLNELRRKQSPY